MRKNLIAAAAALVLLSAAIGAAAASDRNGADAGSANTGVAKVTVSIADLAFNANNASQASAGASAASNQSASSSQARSANADAAVSASAIAEVSSDSGSGSAVSDAGGDTTASSAAAVYITTSDDTCMGSSSVGGQGDAFGFSVGSTWTDSNCIMLKNARELKAQGHHKAAKMRLCMDEDNATAFELAGEPCPRALASTQAAIANLRASDMDSAAAQPAVQLAALGPVGGFAAPSSGSADGPGETGTLLTMVQSVALHVAAAFTPSSPSEHFAKPYPMDGIE